MSDSNWIIPRRLAVGGAPTSDAMIRKLARAGFDIIVSLLDDHDYANRLKATPAAYAAAARKEGIAVFAYPIDDGSITSDNRAFRIAREVFAMVSCGARVYMHCWGGHGRAGTIAAMVTGLWYQVDLPLALRFVKRAHDTRGYPTQHPGVYKTPQTEEQVRQVARFFADLEAQTRLAAQRASCVTDV